MAWFRWPLGKKDESNKVDDLTTIIDALKKKTVPISVTNEFLGIIEEVEGIRQKLQQVHTAQSAIDLIQKEFDNANMRNDIRMMRVKSGELEELKSQKARTEEITCKSLGKLGTRIGTIEKIRSKEVAKDTRNLVRGTMLAIAQEVNISQYRINEHKKAGNWF